MTAGTARRRVKSLMEVLCADSVILPLLGCACLAAAAGCQPNQGPTAAAEVPAIPVSRPAEREVRNFEDFTGQTDAVQVVDVRARVTGYLTEALFREGSEVQEGDLLFKIDPRPYQDQLDQAQAQVVANEASYNFAKSVYSSDLAAPNAVSREQLAQDYAAVEQAHERLKAAVASTEVYKLNMEFTQVRSPISGQISRYYVTRGNLINQDSTLLTTVVSLDPMYAYFEMDEPTLLRIRRAIREGRMRPPEEGTMPVLMGLQGEDGYPHQGVINFFNNQVNSATGSISLRGVFANPLPPEDVPRLTAGASPCSARPALSAGVPSRPWPCPLPDGCAAAPGCCPPACSSGFACRSATRIPPCSSSTAPSCRTRGRSTSTCWGLTTRSATSPSRPGRFSRTACARSAPG